MNKIDISSLASKLGLDLTEIALQLFPTNIHPKLALHRVILGKAVLNADQISKLALICGLSISELFTSGEWSVNTSDKIHTFKNGEFTAELNTSNWTTRLFHNGSLFHTLVIHNEYVTLSEYVTLLNSEINKFKQNAKN